MFAQTRKVTALAVLVVVASLAVAAALPGIASAASDPSAPYTAGLTSVAGAPKVVAEGSETLSGVAARTAVQTAAPRSTAAPAAKAAAGTELSRAKAILAGLVAQHPILAGTTVTIGDAKGYQAISYYKSGRIVISATHTATLERILNHEVWHIIDWRDNGRIDWGENIPPR